MFTFRYLMHVQAKQEDGFTLIEILIVIVIIGIIAAISLPSFLNQANKARQAEAVTNIGAMNKAQQAHFVESSQFTADMADLAVGINPGTSNYSYEIQAVDLTKAVSNVAQSQNNALYSFVGITGLTNLNSYAKTNASLVCRENLPTGMAVVAATVDFECPATFDILK